MIQHWALADNITSSHILLIAIVGAFAVYFYIVNRQQGRGLKVLEGVVSAFYQ